MSRIPEPGNACGWARRSAPILGDARRDRPRRDHRAGQSPDM